METEISEILRRLEKAHYDLFLAKQNSSYIEEKLLKAINESVLNGREK